MPIISDHPDHTERPTSLSADALILFIAVMSGFLPLIVYLSVEWFFIWDHHQPTLSEYVYTSARPFFIGIVFALGVVLYFYRGYPNNSGPIPLSDNQLADLAGVGAMITAIIPSNTCVTYHGNFANDFHSIFWGYVHLLGATLTFGAMALFFLFYFTQTGGVPYEQLSQNKRVRNRIYQICGGVVACGMAFLMIAKIYQTLSEAPKCNIVNQIGYVFWAEAVMLAAISIAWLTKFAGRKMH